jgi:Fe2+ transport system protein FeoA
VPVTLSTAQSDLTYIISRIEAAEAGMKDFLFSLGCYPGQPVTVISRLSSNVVINVKNARYSIDSRLADAIRVHAPATAGSGINAAGDELKVG